LWGGFLDALVTGATFVTSNVATLFVDMKSSVSRSLVDMISWAQKATGISLVDSEELQRWRTDVDKSQQEQNQQIADDRDATRKRWHVGADLEAEAKAADEAAAAWDRLTAANEEAANAANDIQPKQQAQLQFAQPAAQATAAAKGGNAFIDARTREGFSGILQSLRPNATDPQKRAAAALERMAVIQQKQLEEQEATTEAIESQQEGDF
jgi:hypothetical protein